jgi:hypothetical protein
MSNRVIKNITLSNGNRADFDTKYWNGNETLKTINGYSLFGSGNISISTDGVISNNLLIEISYSELKNLRDSSILIPGQQYRITDYVTTTSQENTETAGYQFDIIVTALNEYKLCEEAHVIQNKFDGYFDSCNLAAWKIWYCLDNDTNRFGWANKDNGTGVIYRMIDEWGNDCPYDFKNIMFEGNYFTFSYEDDDNIILDASIVGNNGFLLNDKNNIPGVYNNVIKSYIDENNKQHLNINVFVRRKYCDDVHFYGYHNNVFGNNCYNNTFGNNCHNNTFGNNCSNNKFIYHNDDIMNNIRNVRFGDDVSDLLILLDDRCKYLRNINVIQGVNGVSIDMSNYSDRDYETTNCRQIRKWLE